MNLIELEASEQILSRLSPGSVAINVSNSLLGQRRFQMLILDQDLTPLCHKRIADRWFHFIKDARQTGGVKSELIKQIRGLPGSKSINNLNAMHVLDFADDHGAYVYVRSI